MSNNILTNEVALPFLMEFEASLPVLANGNTQFNKNFVAGNGETVYALKPSFGNNVITGGDLSGVGVLGDVDTAKVAITLVQYSKGVELSLVEQSLKLQNMRDQIDVPRSALMASDVQKVAIDELFLGAGNVNVVSTIQLTPSATADKTGYLDISKGIAALHTARSTGEKTGIMSPELATIVMNSGLQFFQADLKDTFINGKLGTFRGARFYETQDIGGYLTTTSALTTSLVINQPTAYVAGATTLAVDGLSAATATIEAGTAFTCAGVYSVDLFGVSTGKLFPIIAQATATGSGSAASVTIRGLYATGAAKNVTALPANDATCTMLHAPSKSYHKVLIWDKQAFAVASAKLAPMDDAKEQVNVNGKITNLVMSRGGNFLASKNYIRWDVLIGFKVIYNNMIARVDVVTA